MSSVRYHRILRRGREYGVYLSTVKAMAPAAQDEPESGMHFICLNANILRQFEFLQNAWIASTKFSGLTGESDPLLGDRERYRAARLPAISTFRKTAASGAEFPDCRNSSRCKAGRIAFFQAFGPYAISQEQRSFNLSSSS